MLLFAYLALFGVIIGAQGVLWAELPDAPARASAPSATAQLVSPVLSVALLMAGAQLAHWPGKKSLAIAGLVFLAGSNLALASADSLASLLGVLLLAGAGNALLETAANGAMPRLGTCHRA